MRAPVPYGAPMDGHLRVTPSCSRSRSTSSTWRFGRSGGPGGQHANTSDTRAEVRFDVASSPSLGPRQRARLLERLGPVVTAAASDTRSQARNRELALERLRSQLAAGLRVERPRRATRPGRAARERRLEQKRHRRRAQARPRPPPEEAARGAVTPVRFPRGVDVGALVRRRASCSLVLVLDSAMRTFVLPAGRRHHAHPRGVREPAGGLQRGGPRVPHLRGARSRDGAVRARSGCSSSPMVWLVIVRVRLHRDVPRARRAALFERAFEMSGSSLLTLGFVRPPDLADQHARVRSRPRPGSGCSRC